MGTLVHIFAVVTILLLAQSITAASTEDLKNVRQYVDIENITYYVEGISTLYRDEAKDLCESLNMTLVRFESEDKWNAINTWLSGTPFIYHWFWTGALRDEGNTTWYWEQTGEEIVEFYWASGQPSLDDYLIRTCMDFSYKQGGWDDDGCLAFTLNVMCQ